METVVVVIKSILSFVIDVPTFISTQKNDFLIRFIFSMTQKWVSRIKTIKECTTKYSFCRWFIVPVVLPVANHTSWWVYHIHDGACRQDIYLVTLKEYQKSYIHNQHAKNKDTYNVFCLWRGWHTKQVW